eukprot:930097-Alexandrium_andersonii.AAC.1
MAGGEERLAAYDLRASEVPEAGAERKVLGRTAARGSGGARCRRNRRKPGGPPNPEVSLSRFPRRVPPAQLGSSGGRKAELGTPADEASSDVHQLPGGPRRPES